MLFDWGYFEAMDCGFETPCWIWKMALTNKWYAPKYSGATYASKLRTSSDLIGVFETAPATLALRGVVSPADGLYRTELAYDPSVSVLSFPH